MSIPFSSTSNKNGIIQLIERNTKVGDGGISGVATRLAEVTADVNLALDKVLEIIFQNSSTWQFDDSNQTDYPFITTNLVANQRDYSFTADGSGNLVLDIFKVMIKPGTSATDYYVELPPIDQESADNTSGFWNGQNAASIPARYDKTANGIFLDPVPSYSVADGLKIFINREASYFTTSDTTKKPGFAGLFHEYLALRPSYQYAYRNGLPNVNVLKQEMLEMEDKIANYYSERTRDERQQIITKHRSSR